MAEKQVLALSGKSRGVLRLEYGQELAFSLESPAYLRDAELWLLFSDREWSILDRCKGSCTLPARRVQAAAVARGGQFLMAGGRADFSAARSACFTRQEKKRLKELEVSARQRPKPSEIAPAQPEEQIFRGEQRKSAGSTSVRQGAGDERPAQAVSARQKSAAPWGQKTVPQAQPASEPRQKMQSASQMRQGEQERVQAGQAQWTQEGRGQKQAAPVQAGGQGKARETGGQEEQSTAPQPLGRSALNERTAWKTAPQETSAAPEPRSQAQPASEPGWRFGQESAQNASEPTPQTRQGGTDGASAEKPAGWQSRQWENLPEYISTPALEELMRAAQPQSTSPRRGRAGMQEPRRHSFSAPQAGQMQGSGQEGLSARQGQGAEDERPAQAASARQETAAFSQIVQPSSASEMHQPGSTPAQQEQAAWEQKTAPAARVPSALEPRQKAQSAPQLRPGEGRQKAAGPSARSAPEQAASGQSAQAVPETAAHSSAQKAKAQPERPQSGQQKQGAKSAPRYACIQRTEKSVQPFPKIFPSSKWVKVEYPSFPGRGYYLSGEIFQGEKCAAKALAVPGRYALNPPAWLKGFETYLEDASAQGYWLLFQDMQGKAIPISQVFKGSQG